MQNDISRHWAVLMPYVPGEMLTAQARQVESIGMAGIEAWQVWAAPWPTLSHCAAVTERVQLATGLANALTRSPFETALTAIDIDRLSGGRFVLGLGPSIRAWTQGFAQGVVGHPIWTTDWILKKVMPTLEGSLAKAGKDRKGFHYNQWFWTAINNDRAEAINDAKATTAFYASTRQYEPFFAAHGFEKEARACQEAMLAKDMVAFVGAVTDEMAHTFVMAGTPDDIRKRVEQVWDTCDSFCLVPPMAGLETEKILFYIKTIAETSYG